MHFAIATFVLCLFVVLPSGTAVPVQQACFDPPCNKPTETDWCYVCGNALNACSDKSVNTVAEWKDCLAGGCRGWSAGTAQSCRNAMFTNVADIMKLFGKNVSNDDICHKLHMCDNN